ncbi:hypothetical protein FA13DRAFT_1102336 [Coprinellus micaceus]|uniref:Uncharacterized protein n=1 Tax=Coprinellus micaceus TaxID=71717 RepID=A0A4Y7SXA4_COPMI|nr:hypothetical protein FA13DRAFT_1102336 [Coprinellus micaceus]
MPEYPKEPPMPRISLGRKAPVRVGIQRPGTWSSKAIWIREQPWPVTLGTSICTSPSSFAHPVERRPGDGSSSRRRPSLGPYTLSYLDFPGHTSQSEATIGPTQRNGLNGIDNKALEDSSASSWTSSPLCRVPRRTQLKSLRFGGTFTATRGFTFLADILRAQHLCMPA